MFIEPTREQAQAFFDASLEGPLVMLNLLRFREVADYSQNPHLAPPKPISDSEAYKLFAQHTMPFVDGVGSQVLFQAAGHAALIGPEDERWDLVLLVCHLNMKVFSELIANEAYRKGMGHRTAALADSRLLPLTASTPGGG